MGVGAVKNLKFVGQKYLQVYNKLNGKNCTSILQTKNNMAFSQNQILRYAPDGNIFHNQASNERSAIGLGVIFNEFKSFFKPKYPAFLQNVLGENVRICRDFQDLGGICSAKALFKRKAPHLIAIDTAKSDWKRTFKTHDISCIYDKKGDLKRVFLFDWVSRDLSVLNKKGELLRTYSSSETRALFNYKSDSKLIHNVLRDGKVQGDSDETLNVIDSLQKVFETGKTDVLQEDILVYRALDKKALKSILSSKEDKCIYIEPSFLSVATKKSSVFQFLNFRNFNHILELEIPAGTPVLKMDEIGHVINPQFAENELILNVGQKLLIEKSNGRLRGKLMQEKAPR